MNITLKPEQEIVVQNLLAQGEFQTVDEVIYAALALLETEQQAYQAWLVDTRAKV